MQTPAELVKKVNEALDGKDKSNGENTARVANMLRQVYPDGIQPDQYEDALGMAKICDTLTSAASQDGSAKPKKPKAPAKDLGVGPGTGQQKPGESQPPEET